MSQLPAPPTHATIFEEDEDEDENEEELNDQENQPPPSVENRPSTAIFQHQTRTLIVTHPPTILETLVNDDDEHGVHEHRTLQQAEEQDAEQEMVDELNVRRSSVRHSWVTVSRWLE